MRKEKLKSNEKGMALIYIIGIVLAVILIVGIVIAIFVNKNTNKTHETTTNESISNNDLLGNALAGLFPDGNSLVEVPFGITEKNEKINYCSIKLPSNYSLEGRYRNEYLNVISDFDKNDVDDIIQNTLGYNTIEEILEVGQFSETSYPISSAFVGWDPSNATKLEIEFVHSSIEIEEISTPNGTEYGTKQHPSYYYIINADEKNYIDCHLKLCYKINDNLLILITYYCDALKNESNIDKIAQNLYNIIKVDDEENPSSISTKNTTLHTQAIDIELSSETNLSDSKLSLEDAKIKNEGEVEIPEFIMFDGKEYRVISIGKKAFADCKNLTSITMPNSVTQIGERAFYNCTSLENIQFSERLLEISDLAFSGCSNIKKLNLPNTVISIGEKAFAYCKSLIEFVFPCFAEFDSGVFYGCSALEKVELPKYSNEKAKLSWDTFHDCTSLKTIVIPDYFTEIGSYAFGNCSSLESIEWKGEVYTDKDVLNQKFDTKVWTDASFK